MVVVHAFQEADELRRSLHLNFWFGTVPSALAAEDSETGTAHPVICWCGGRRVDFSDDVIACFHQDEWPDYLEDFGG